MSDKKDVTVEDKIKLLTDWIGIIQSDIATMQKERDAEYDVYKKQKDMYDSWLAKRWKRVVKVEKKMNESKKNIEDINREIDAIRNRPAPGVLPPLDEVPKHVPRKPTITELDLTDVSIELSPEERASLSKEAQS